MSTPTIRHQSDLQIAEEIAKLRTLQPQVVHFSAWGDDNRAAIEAAIDTLSERLSQEDVYNRFGTGNEHEAGMDDQILQVALRAQRWMTGRCTGHDGAVSEEGWPLTVDIGVPA